MKRVLEKQVQLFVFIFPWWLRIAWAVQVQAKHKWFHTVAYFLVNKITISTAYLF